MKRISVAALVPLSCSFFLFSCTTDPAPQGTGRLTKITEQLFQASGPGEIGYDSIAYDDQGRVVRIYGGIVGDTPDLTMTFFYSGNDTKPSNILSYDETIHLSYDAQGRLVKDSSVYSGSAGYFLETYQYNNNSTIVRNSSGNTSGSFVPSRRDTLTITNGNITGERNYRWDNSGTAGFYLESVVQNSYDSRTNPLRGLNIWPALSVMVSTEFNYSSEQFGQNNITGSSSEFRHSPGVPFSTGSHTYQYIFNTQGKPDEVIKLLNVSSDYVKYKFYY